MRARERKRKYHVPSQRRATSEGQPAADGTSMVSCAAMERARLQQLFRAGADVFVEGRSELDMLFEAAQVVRDLHARLLAQQLGD